MTPGELIATSLASIDLAFEMKINAHGHAFAAFNAIAEHGETFPMTMIAQGPWLKLTAFRILPGPVGDNQLRMFAELALGWGFGRVYFDDRNNSFEAAIGLDAGDGPPRRDALRAAVGHLAASAVRLRAFGQPTFAAPPDATTMAQVRTILAALGISVDGADVVGWGVRERTGAEYAIEVEVRDGALIVRGLRDRPLVVDRAALDAIQRLNRQLAAGTVQLAHHRGELFYELHVPLAWFPLTATSLRRYLDEARMAMFVVDEAFP